MNIYHCAGLWATFYMNGCKSTDASGPGASLTVDPR